MEPRVAKHGLKPEMLLEIGLMASVFIPVSLLMFGWTARASVHWYVRPVLMVAYRLFDSLQDGSNRCSIPLPARHLLDLPVYSDVPRCVLSKIHWVCASKQRSLQVIHFTGLLVTVTNNVYKDPR